MTDSSGASLGTIVMESNTVPQNYRFVEYKCGFKNRLGVKTCPWTTGLVERKAAVTMIGEHWNYEHEDEHKKIQMEKDMAREREMNEVTEALKQREYEEQIEREANLFKKRMEYAATLQRMQN